MPARLEVKREQPLPLTPGALLSHQALLLTGTGVTNQAALHACGLNAEEAKHHFREAVSSGEEGVAVPAVEALEWCEMEVRGLLMYSDVVLRWCEMERRRSWTWNYFFSFFQEIEDCLTAMVL